MSEVRLVLGDCLDKLKEMDANSVDSIVTDPPYGLSAAPNSGKNSKGGFMGKQWDYDVPSVEIWQECMRVLKPGGHLLAFAGSRTYHRMAVRIEDAGFEIRDMISWLYGSGFPKSMDISKQIDKQLGVEREVVGTTKGKGGDNLNKLSRTGKGDSDDAKSVGAYGQGAKQITIDIPITAPATDEAKEWSGWGTALKPAHEPVVMARKPLSENTVVDNVLKWGTGGINIDESRIGTDEELGRDFTKGKSDIFGGGSGIPGSITNGNPNGRFPANLILDEEAGKMLDEQSGVTKSGKVKENKSAYGGDSNTGFLRGVSTTENQYGDIGGASRFFYCPKVGKGERNEGLDGFEEKPRSDMNKMMGESGNFKTGSGNDRTTKFKNTHPTVKPVDLMLYLIRLVTPKGGTTLDPFMGSGSTGKAAVRGGFGFVGIEREQEYFDIAEARIEYERNRPVGKSSDKTKNKTVEPKVEETLTKFFE